MKRLREWSSELEPAEIALIVVVLIGYVSGVASNLSGGGDLTAADIVISLALTAVYLALMRGADQFFDRYPAGWGKAAYFAGLLLLVGLAIGALGPGAWLIALPLAALAVEYLPRPWQRLLVYVGILLSLALPFLLDGDWQQAFFFALTLSPAILFVVVFTRLVQSERQARERAEALAEELEEANRRLAASAAQVEELARTRERNRLAREIHDNLGHYLTVVNVQIRAAQAVMAADPDKAQMALEKAQRLTQEGLDAVRQSVAALRESPLGERPLPQALQDLLEETAAAGVSTELQVLGTAVALNPRVTLALYRAAQEGLTNVRKHAQADRVAVTLDYQQQSAVILRIADNGTGLDAQSSAGYGLLGIRERVELLAGDMQVSDTPGGGLTLEVRLPVRAQITPPLAAVEGV